MGPSVPLGEPPRAVQWPGCIGGLLPWCQAQHHPLGPQSTGAWPVIGASFNHSYLLKNTTYGIFKN